MGDGVTLTLTKTVAGNFPTLGYDYAPSAAQQYFQQASNLWWVSEKIDMEFSGFQIGPLKWLWNTVTAGLM
jgi:hypothetical protein